MKFNKGIITGLGLFALPILLQAQLLVQSEPTPVDSIVMLTAEAQCLPLMAREDLPRTGTFWLVTAGFGTGAAVPLPCPPTDTSLPVFQMADGQFLVDGTKGQVNLNAKSTLTVESALTAQAEAVVNLIGRVQETEMMSEVGMLFGMELDSGGGMEMPLFAVTDPDGLWLEITNLANGFVHANLHNATNQVYAIWGTTDLLTPWQVETTFWPADTNCEPFTVATQNRQMLFLRAEDWTDKDSNADGVPDWWAWQYFGDVSLVLTNLDYSGSGLTFAEDYTNNITPKVFTFSSVQASNNYVQTSSPTVQLEVTGTPYYLAVLVDDTNFANAVWNPYSNSSVTLNLGSAEGWHEMWIGLRGHGEEPSQAVWQWKRLKLDTTAPQLVITRPTNGTVEVPIIQLTGFSPEKLAVISYDLSHTNGTMTNQLIVITGQAYSTNTWEFTTNYFHGYDVPLTEGLNVITLQAKDEAGNVTTTNFNFTLDYTAKTNPPVVQLLWPTDKLEIVGSNIVCRGWVSDDTATVTVQLVDANGETNRAESLVSREGVFYADNLTLAAGTNYLSYTVTDAAGNEATTNILVLTSDLALTLDPVVAGQSWVTGTIGDTNYTVYVNGVRATKDGFGTWSAEITPICVGGGAVVVNAVVDGLDPSIQQIVPSPEGVFVSQYHYRREESDEAMRLFYRENLDFQDGQSGVHDSLRIRGNLSSNILSTLSHHTTWPTNWWPQPFAGGIDTVTLAFLYTSPPLTNTYVYETGGPDLKLEHREIKKPVDYDDAAGMYWLHCRADTEVKLATGGPPGSRQQNLWCISASATDADTGLPIAFTNIAIGGFGNLDTNGQLWVVLPDNDPDDVTPREKGNDNYTFTTPAGTKYHPYISLNEKNLDYNTPTNCVGEQLTFSIGWFPYPPENIADMVAIWSLPGTLVNTNSDPNCDLYYSKDATQLNRIKSRDGTTSTSCWYVDALRNGQVGVAINVELEHGKQIVLQTSGKFSIHRPTTAKGQPYQPDGTPTAQILNGTLSLGVSGVTNDMSFKHTINPGDFSGQAGYVQLITSADVINANPPPAPFNGTALDAALGEFPRGTPDVPVNTNTSVWFYDAPHAGLPSSLLPVSEDVSFSTHLMFRPSGGIWVPLRLITWELHDHADPEWTPYNSNDGKTTRITSDNDSTDFPHWTTTW